MVAKIIPLTRPEPNFSAALILSTVPANPKNRNTGIPLKIEKKLITLVLRERPLMTSDFRVGRGVQNDPKNRTF